MKAKIRKIVTFVDETLSEQGQMISPPLRRAAAVAVIENPYAGIYQEDLSLLIDIGEELGGLLGQASERHEVLEARRLEHELADVSPPRTRG